MTGPRPKFVWGFKGGVRVEDPFRWICDELRERARGFVITDDLNLARYHVYDLFSGRRYDFDEVAFEAAVAAWMQGWWEAACEIVAEAIDEDPETLKAAKRPRNR